MRNDFARHVVWNLDDMYTGPDDPALLEDEQWCREEAAKLTAKYHGKIAGLTASGFATALTGLEQFSEKVQKIVSYSFLYFSTRTNNPRASALWQKAVEFESEMVRDSLFFELEWKNLGDEQANTFLAAPDIQPYYHFLGSLRRYKPHTLSEPEEKILAETASVAVKSWTTLFSKIQSSLRFGEEQRTQSEVLSCLYDPDRSVRKAAAEDLTKGLLPSKHILTHVMNTVLLDRSITDRLREYSHWLSARNLDNKIDDDVVQALLHAVIARYDLVSRYYTLKRRILGYDELYDYDRYAPIPNMSASANEWDTARELVLSAYHEFSPEMGETATGFFSSNWIHAAVMEGKQAGAFSHPAVPGVHPYVLLNYTGQKRDIMTLAHEIGHGIHQYLARRQGLFNSAAPLTLAETASVFGEMLVFEKLLNETGNGGERLALLCSKIEDILATIFRQVSMSSFENLIHTERRKKGELSSERISELWMETQREMFGDSVKLLDHYEIWWSYVPHFIHTPGYVYAYAFGNLLVFALMKQYRDIGKKFIPLYIELLQAGGNGTPEDLLKPFSIDMSNPEFWSESLTFLKDMLAEAEALAG